MAVHFKVSDKHLPTVKRILPDWPCLPNNLGASDPPPPVRQCLSANMQWLSQPDDSFFRSVNFGAAENLILSGNRGLVQNILP